jgi:hypothetical protein
MMTCSICGSDHPTAWDSATCIRALVARIDALSSRFDALHDQVSAANRRADDAHAKIAALESAQRPQPAPPGGGEAQQVIWVDGEFKAVGKPTPPAPADTRLREMDPKTLASPGAFTVLDEALAPADATGGDDGLELREFLEDMADEQRHGKLNTESPLRATAYANNDRLLRLAANRLDELRRERDQYRDTLLARHGGEPVALLSELDEARRERDQLDRRLSTQISVNSELTAEAGKWAARADAAEAKVAGLTALVRKIGPRTVTDCAAAIRKDWPLSASLLLAIDAALTTPAQRSESNDGG